MNIIRNMSDKEILNMCQPETEREQVLFDKLSELLEELSDLEDSQCGDD